MYILASNMWFTTLIKQFFFSIDKIVFNFISSIYDVLITIARTSVLSQADIADMADRIYKLLAIFMVFKVTLSLITYVVNPDDFSDKSKGISKLSKNIIISLALLILTPYLFNYAYQFQTIILEDNSLSTLIFGEDSTANGTDSFFNSAGDKMAYTTISAFFSPNLSLEGLIACDTISELQGEKKVFSDECYKAMEALLDPDEVLFTRQSLDNYKIGVEKGNFGMLFRQELAVATDPSNQDYIMDYKFIFSTIVGVVIILLLINFCMDIAVRSIKLAFLQLVAPIPIISYVDPKSGKDGLFKKWYDMCFKTYLSLFVRLLALYFAVYIISNVADMRLVDVIDGSYVTNGIIAIFIIIGALMFAKQLPKILEGLGIKLDGGGKFTLNPLKKFEEEALGGKRITGAARGALVGAGGMLTGAGAGRAISGAWRGMKSGKGWKETGQAEAEMNKKMRQARLDGSTFMGRMGAKASAMLGTPSRSENIEGQIHKKDESIKDHKNSVKALELERDAKKAAAKERARKADLVSKSMGDAKTTFIEKMKEGKGAVGQEYLTALDRRDAISSKLGEVATFVDSTGQTVTRAVTAQDIADANAEVRELENNGWMRLINEQMANPNLDAKLQTKLDVAIEDYATANGISVADAKARISDGATLNRELGAAAGTYSRAQSEQRTIDEEYYEEIKSHNDSIEVLEKEKGDLYEKQRVAKANESVVK